MTVSPAASAAPLADRDLETIDAYWRASNYLSVGQIYLLANPLLREPLRLEHVKPRLLGHWGTTPGLNFVYVHMNRAIVEHDLSAIYITGPGHGGPGLVANSWLEGSYTEIYHHVGQDEEGMRRLFRQFSFPGGVPSHVAPETPGSIHEGGELGYALVHAYGAAFDNPDLLVCAVVGDGEAETGPLAASWHSNKFVDPRRDGAVLPILHLNGYKIANPTVLARIPREDLQAFFEGNGHKPYFVEGSDPEEMHQLMAATLDTVVEEIRGIQGAAREGGVTGPFRWPMIVLITPKGWTGPKEVDGKQTEGSYRSHQVPLSGLASNPGHLRQLEEWLRSYRPEELFDETGAPMPELLALAPRGERRMGANPHANGGLLLRNLELPDFRDYAVDVPGPAKVTAEATRVLGTFLRDVMRKNDDRFRLFGPDETESNRLGAVFEATARTWDAELLPTDDDLAPDGRVMEVLCEHLCMGWLEGFLLTGRSAVKSASNAASDMPCGCSLSGCSRIRSTTFTTLTLRSGRSLRRRATADSVSSVGMSPAHAITTSGSSPASLLAQSQMPIPRVQWRIASSIDSHVGAEEPERLRVGALVGQAVDQPRVPVVGEDDGPVAREERIELGIGQPVRVL